MCWASNKNVYALLLCAFLFPLTSFGVDFGSVNVVASGKDLQEAMQNALHEAIVSNLQKDKSLDKAVLKAIVENELIDTAQIVSSYKILETGSGGFVNISATVETDVVKALSSIIPKNFGGEKDAKAFVVIKTGSLPAPALHESLVKTLEAVATDKLTRRKFRVITGSDVEEADAYGDEIVSQEALQSLGDKAGAALSIGMRLQHNTVENENTHVLEDRLSINAVVVDNKKGRLLHRFNSSLLLPKPTKKDALVNDWTHTVEEDGSIIFQNILIRAGEHFLAGDLSKGGIVLRIVSPPNFQALTKLRTGIEGMKEVKSLVELSIQRGAYDFLLRSSVEMPLLQKKILALELDGVHAEVSEQGGDPTSMILLALKQTETPAVTDTKEN